MTPYLYAMDHMCADTIVVELWTTNATMVM